MIYALLGVAIVAIIIRAIVAGIARAKRREASEFEGENR